MGPFCYIAANAAHGLLRLRAKGPCNPLWPEAASRRTKSSNLTDLAPVPPSRWRMSDWTATTSQIARRRTDLSSPMRGPFSGSSRQLLSQRVTIANPKSRRPDVSLEETR